MTEAKDFRLGNLVILDPKLSNPGSTLHATAVEIAIIAQDKIGYTPYKLEQRVEPFEDDLMVQMETIFKPIQAFKPIPLTMEILVHSGFEHSNGAYQFKGFLPQLIIESDRWYADFAPGSKRIEIKFVHQLQNLYYILMMDDLEIVL